jgi:hypothetical protein
MTAFRWPDAEAACREARCIVVDELEARGFEPVRTYRETVVYQAPSGCCVRLTESKAHVYPHPDRCPGYPPSELALHPAAAALAFVHELDRHLTETTP